MLDNKETNDSVQVTINLGPIVTAAQMIELTGPALDGTNGYTIGGAAINPDQRRGRTCRRNQIAGGRDGKPLKRLNETLPMILSRQRWRSWPNAALICRTIMR